MKQIILVLGVLACVSMLAQAQLDKPITRNYQTAAGPTSAFDSIGVSALATPGLPAKPLARLVMYTIHHWGGTDTLNVVQSTSDTSATTTRIQVGPGTTYTTPRAVPLICIKIRGTATGIKYSLVIQ
jgi:hypothetical protein